MECLQIVQKGLEILLKNIQPFIEETLMKVYGNDFWFYLENGPKVISGIDKNNMKDYQAESAQRKYKDVLFYLNSIIKNWELLRTLFSTNYVLCLCHDIKHFRNKWAHQSYFTSREAYRLLDQCQALLEEMKLDVSEIDVVRKVTLEVLYNEEVSTAFLDSNNTNNMYKMNMYINHNNNNNQIANTNVSNMNNFNNPYSPIEYNGNVNGNSNNSNNSKIFEHNEHDDSVMKDGAEYDKEHLHHVNFQKVMNQKNDKNNPYIITFYDAEEESNNNVNINPYN